MITLHEAELADLQAKKSDEQDNCAAELARLDRQKNLRRSRRDVAVARFDQQIAEKQAQIDADNNPPEPDSQPE